MLIKSIYSDPNLGFIFSSLIKNEK